MSYDEGATWPISRRLHGWMTADATCSDPVYTYGGYSSMAKTADYHVGALVERRKKSDERYEIEFHRFNLGFILHGAKEPF